MQSRCCVASAIRASLRDNGYRTYFTRCFPGTATRRRSPAPSISICRCWIAVDIPSERLCGRRTNRTASSSSGSPVVMASRTSRGQGIATAKPARIALRQCTPSPCSTVRSACHRHEPERSTIGAGVAPTRRKALFRLPGRRQLRRARRLSSRPITRQRAWTAPPIRAK